MEDGNDVGINLKVVIVHFDDFRDKVYVYDGIIDQEGIDDGSIVVDTLVYSKNLDLSIINSLNSNVLIIVDDILNFVFSSYLDINYVNVVHIDYNLYLEI